MDKEKIVNEIIQKTKGVHLEYEYNDENEVLTIIDELRKRGMEFEVYRDNDYGPVVYFLAIPSSLVRNFDIIEFMEKGRREEYNQNMCDDLGIPYC